MITKYGHQWPGNDDPIGHLGAEFGAYRKRLTTDDGGLGAAEHFRRICKTLDPGYIWLSDDPDVPFESQWNDRMLDACLRTNWLAVTGPASAGKSAFFARWVGINWLAYFGKCAGVVTSTTKGGARLRIWAHLLEFFRKVQGVFPVHINDTSCVISVEKGAMPNTSDRSSIMLVTPEKDKAGGGDSKLIGLHNDWVFVIGDEYAEMSEAVARACENLQVNPNFFAAFLSNAKSIFDPHGIQCTPKSGDWSEVSDSDAIWPTERGLCLHLDGERTPNQFTNPVDKYPYLQKYSHIQTERDAGRSNTVGYWRFVKAFWPLGGAEEGLYNELELVQSGCTKGAVWLGGGVVELASFDPANKLGGDNWQACFGKLGITKDHVRVLEFTTMEALSEDVTSDTESTSKQIARQFVQRCKDRGIGVRQVVVDATGGGSHMANYIEDVFGEKGILRVEFGASASDLIVSERDGEPITAKEKFGRKDAEIWYAGIQYVKSGQLRNICSKQAEQMCKRRGYTQTRRDYIESKSDYKARTKLSSPDEADAGMLLLDLARQRFGFNAVTTLAQGAGSSTNWKNAMNRFKAPAVNAGGERRLTWQARR